LVPTELALMGTDAFYRSMARLDPRRAAAAAASMAAVIGGTPREAEVARLAPRHVAAIARGWELSWRPWELARIPIRGRERLDAARATGRGLIVSHSHLGPLAGWVPLVRIMRPMLFPQGDWLLDEPRHGYNGYQIEHWRKLYQDAGTELMHHIGSAPRAYRMLRRGGSVLISMDVPGERRTEFLGKPVDLDDGTARLATKAGALVLPASLRPSGRRWEIEIHPALDSREFDGPDELHLALTRVHEELIMQAPEHLESPDRLWARATPEGWYAH
jgi:lauroyl/myristoyl acyltransferase